MRIGVRDAQGSPIAGARLELTLTDLPEVQRRHVVSTMTDGDGRVTVMGSCVRGYLDGRVSIPDAGAYSVHHGYVGTGRDQFDIILPGGPDGGVSYANDD